MSNISTQGSPGPNAPHTTSGPPRRTSYASVAAGVSGAGHQTASVHLPPAPHQYIYPHSSSDQPHHSQAGDAGLQLEGGTGIPETWGSGARESMPAFTSSNFSKQAYNPWGIFPGSTGINGFFKPTYLRGSKYMEELEAIHNENIEKGREEQPTPVRTGHHSLSQRSSNVSLPKMQASHRGMSYEIIEHQPQVIELGPSPLPSKWEEVDKHNSIEIASDGQQVRFVGTSKLSDHEAAAARADHAMPSSAGIYYYEVHIESKGKDGLIGVGFSGAKVALEKLPGWEPDSWAYHGDDGKTFCCQQIGKPFGPTFSSGDTIGCGVDFTDGTAFFTKNGNLLGTAFREIKETALFPSVGMKRPHAHLIANFGQRPFVFDIDTYMERKKQDVIEEINSADVSTLHPALDRDDLTKALVAQYLSHDGYVETAQAFAEEVRRENAALKGTPETSVDNYLAVEEDRDAANRQQIRAAVLEGDIDTTIRLTNIYFPTVFSTHRDINFRVRCRKYIEMMRQSAELWDSYPRIAHTHRNASVGEINGGSQNGADPSDQDMDMDGDDGDDLRPPPATTAELDTVTDGVDERMDVTSDPVFASNSPNPTGYDEIISRTIAYGQELNQEFKDEQDPKFREQFNETMKELFGMLAYKDPRTSPARKWLEMSERAKVAEGLNSAILLSLGKSSSTAIERMYKQTVVLMDLISEDGGPGSLINVRHLLKDGEER